MAAGGRPAVFLDRDGTIIEDRDYLADPAGVKLLPGAAAAIARLNGADLPVVVVTNQSGIARGYFGEAEYKAVAARLGALLREEGAHIDATYHCPHGPDDSPPCDCRKPLPGLFDRAALELGLDLSRSRFIGDRLRDVLPGIRVGGTAYLIGTELREPAGDIPPGVVRVPSLEAAVAHLLAANPVD